MLGRDATRFSPPNFLGCRFPASYRPLPRHHQLRTQQTVAIGTASSCWTAGVPHWSGSLRSHQRLCLPCSLAPGASAAQGPGRLVSG
ncbi:unnamed protein product, partial [Symbiodinium sp. KB8]